jgi:hypothetical protein
MMKRLCIPVVICLLAPGLALWAEEEQSPPPVQHKPRIACDEPTYNFGEMDNSQVVEHTFILRNEGDLSLEIKRAHASCGCTVARLADKMVPPGKQTELIAKLRLKGRNGHQKKRITVESNDPDTPRLMLYLEGDAVSELQPVPNHLFFGRVSSLEPTTRTVELKSHTEPFTITRLEPTTGHFTATSEAVGDGKVHRIHVSTKPPLSPGRLRGHIRVTTSREGFPDINIPVTVEVVGALSVAPREIILASVGNQPATRYVVVRPGEVKEFKVESVETPDPAIEAIVAPLGSDGYRIQLNNLVTKPELQGKVLRIFTDAEGARELTVPFKVLSRP